jgi:RNA polymerase-binding transcription factor DksA
MAAAKKSTAKTPAEQLAAAPAKQTGPSSSTTTKSTVRKSTVTNATVTNPTTGRVTNQDATPQKKANTTPNMSTGSKSHDALHEALPKPRFNKDGLGYTKDFDLPFVKEMFDALQAERVRLTGQAKRLEDEAQQLVQEAEMGDVKFDDEGGEGDSTNVERERDLALSAQARDAVDEIDAALRRIAAGTYGYSVESGRPIPRERLEALPWSSVLVEEKVGGIGRR